MHRLFLLIGANLGDKFSQIQRARVAIAKNVGRELRCSHIYETQAWGDVGLQPSYLNQVLEISTVFDPLEVLERTMQIEDRLGRTRKEKWEARLIDIDLLFFDDLVMHTAALTVPHPLLHQRRFALAPLNEVAADLIHPVLQRSINQLLAHLEDDLEVRIWEGTAAGDEQ